MKKRILFAPVLALCFASCSNTPEATEASASLPTQPVSRDISNDIPANTGIQTLQPVNGQSTPTQAPAAKAVATAGLNPAHGQPGHRCDIPVGTPLNSPLQKAPGNAISQPQTAPAAVPANSNARINPPHGQPGHDCAVAVGAALP